MFKWPCNLAENPRPIIPNYRRREGEFRPEYLTHEVHIKAKPTQTNEDKYISSGMLSCFRRGSK